MSQPQTIFEAAKDAIELAARQGRAVAFTFQGTELHARPKSDPHDL